MSKEYTLADFTDIFDYSTGWFSDSSISSLFYQIFKRFPSMKMVKYKVNQDFLKEIKELYQQDDAFDIFEHRSADSFALILRKYGQVFDLDYIISFVGCEAYSYRFRTDIGGI